MKKALIGAGGFAREIKAHMKMQKMWKNENYEIIFFVDDIYWKSNSDNIYPISEFNPQEYEVLIAVGNPIDRYNICKKLPKETRYFSFVNETAQLLDSNIEIGEGSIICAGSILTTNIKIGKHAHLNLHTTIGHDCRIGDFFTTAPGSKVSGNCKIGDKVYLGTNSSIKEKIQICDEVTVGLNAGVVKNITESGIYVGTPAIKI